MISGNCAVCSAPFKSKRKTQKHCSRDCFGVSQRGKIGPWRGKKMLPFSDERRENMRLGQAGVKKAPFTAEHRKNIGLSRLGFRHSDDTRAQMSESHKRLKKFGPDSNYWKGGRRKRKDGYIYIYSPNHPHKGAYGYVLEHRLVMEKSIGRYLLPGEVVHHINEIRDDNRIENLSLFKNCGEHTAYHNSLRLDRTAPNTQP